MSKNKTAKLWGAIREVELIDLPMIDKTWGPLVSELDLRLERTTPGYGLIIPFTDNGLARRCAMSLRRVYQRDRRLDMRIAVRDCEVFVWRAPGEAIVDMKFPMVKIHSHVGTPLLEVMGQGGNGDEH
jgi:hypothetical protein